MLLLSGGVELVEKFSAMTKSEIIELQTQLNKQGFNLVVDGRWGKKTRDAYAAYLDRDTNVPTLVPPAPKPWWQSRAIWGLIATIVAGFASRYGYEVDSEGLTHVLLQIVEVAGLALALFGTVRRTQPLDATLVAPGLRLPGGTVGVPSAGQTSERENHFLD